MCVVPWPRSGFVLHAHTKTSMDLYVVLLLFLFFGFLRLTAPVSGSPTISITVGVGSNGSTYIFVRCIAPAGAIQMDHCLIKVYVNDSLLADLRAPELSCIPVPYTLADGESIFVNASGRVVTRCNQTSLEGFNTYEYTYNNTQVISQNSNSTATSCPPNKGSCMI